MSDRIVTPCPACGQGTLIIGNGGYLTCGLLGCPDPTLLDRLLSDPYAREHVVTFTRTGFHVQHPLTERGEDLVECDLHQLISLLDGPPVALGKYVARHDGERWRWAEIEMAS
jgi:hypothetical protein